MTRALYPGTFDPIHNGHINIVTRAAVLFDDVVIGVFAHPRLKHVLFSAEERLALVERSVAHLPNVRVATYETLTVAFARSIKADTLVRGLRAVSDFEWELQMALTNRALASDVEMVCLMADQEWVFLSSSIVKEVAGVGGDISRMVPSFVAEALEARFAAQM